MTHDDPSIDDGVTSVAGRRSAHEWEWYGKVEVSVDEAKVFGILNVSDWNNGSPRARLHAELDDLLRLERHQARLTADPRESLASWRLRDVRIVGCTSAIRQHIELLIPPEAVSKRRTSTAVLHRVAYEGVAFQRHRFETWRHHSDRHHAQFFNRFSRAFGRIIGSNQIFGGQRG